MSKALFSVLKESPAFMQLAEAAKSKQVISVYGLSEGHRAYVAAALHQVTGRQVLLVTSGELQASRAADDIGQLLGGQSALLPPQELQFGRGASSHDSTWRRLETLHKVITGEVKVLSTSAEALMNRQIPMEVFRDATLRFAPGERIAPQTLVEQLVRNGYERVNMVEGKGQCALRGAIVDVYPPSEPYALRLEFFDDEVDSVRAFDCISQRSLHNMKVALMPPAAEVLVAGIPDVAAAAQRMRSTIGVTASLPPPTSVFDDILGDEDELPSFFDTSFETTPAEDEETRETFLPTVSPLPTERLTTQIAEDADRLAAGHPFRRMQTWVHILYEKTVSLVQWMPGAILLIDQPDQMQNRIESRHQGFAEEWKSLLERRETVAEQADLLYDYGQVLSFLQQETIVTLSDFLRGMGSLKPGALIEMESVGIPAYQANLKTLAEDCRKWRKDGYSIAILAGGESRAKRLQKTLGEMEVPAVYAQNLEGNLVIGEIFVAPMAYTKGFIWPEAKLVVVADGDIYGAGYRKTKARRNAGEKISAFTELKLGDYVVHETHGVGVYRGTISLMSEGTRRDYVYIQYHGNDKLYVPADQLDRVQRFIGAQGQAPKINRLGGREWQRQKGRVKAGIKAMAFDLAKLYATRQATKGHAFAADTAWQAQFEDNFPYELTADQQQSIADIKRDMESTTNMDRLLCGDVGYGKTEVALRAAFKAVMDGKQVAILAPTTILAQQHYNTMKKRFEGFPVESDVISRFRSAKEQKDILRMLKEGNIDVIVGTHRLLGKDVQFRDLGLLIVDEEQRFGVSHKEVIKNMKKQVDVLTLSATPIPRTLHMSMVGIRDMSLLETPPEERFPVQTHVVEYGDALMRDAILRELNRGGQVYFLYNRVQSIERFYSRLRDLVPEARIAIAHGQMREHALEDVMMDFYSGNYDVLLCTTIIESGLDIPTANTLIVFDADRFGLSQLYQLRGRVGRSNRQAYAYFTVRPEHMLTETAQKRLSAIREFTEFGAGFRIAMRDLEIRGSGNILGAEQSGQLSTVGYDLYCKMIEETIREMRGEMNLPEELETKIELRMNAFLPPDYINDERQRMEIYRRISMIQDKGDRDDVEEELIDRFGDLPGAVVNLLSIAYLRALARSLGIAHVSYRRDAFMMPFDEKFAPDPTRLITALSAADARLTLLPAKPPALQLRDPKLALEEMLQLGIKVLEGLRERVQEDGKEG